MKIKGSYKYKSAIIITPEKITELVSFINKYYQDIEYQITILNGTKIAFDSLDELLLYDNSNNRRIQELVIFGQLGNNSNAFTLYFSVETSIWGNYEYTIDIDYYFEKIDDEIVFRTKIKEIFEKMKASYSAISKISAFYFFAIAYFAFSIICILYYNEAMNILLTPLHFLIGFSGFLLGVLCSRISRKIKWRLLPPIVYLWGEEITRYKRLSNLRSKIFWTIFIGIIVGIIVFFITNFLLK